MRLLQESDSFVISREPACFRGLGNAKANKIVLEGRSNPYRDCSDIALIRYSVSRPVQGKSKAIGEMALVPVEDIHC